MKNAHPDYPFILVANRDELYSRPAAPIQRWTDEPTVIAGIDLEEKGTWLGYTDKGKFIAVLNHPFTGWEPKRETPRSRGQLLRDYLTQEIPIKAFNHKLQTTRTDYQGYHLLYGTFNHLHYYSNVNNQFHTFPSGLHCLANTTDDLSKHRKDRSSERLAQYVAANKEKLNLEELTQLMQDRKRATTIKEYPKELNYETVQQNTPIFIQGEEFGTVGTTAILVDKQGNVQVREVKYDQNGITQVTTKEQTLNIQFSH